MDFIAFSLYLIGSIATIAIFYFVGSRESRPRYLIGAKESIPQHGSNSAIESKSIYRLAAIVSASVGLLLALLQSFSINGLDLLGLITVTLTSMVTFILVVSIYTDLKYRLVDRVLLRAAMLFSILMGIPRLIEIQDESVTILYMVGVLLSFALIFIPMFGASDARTYVILFAAGIPMLGVVDTFYVLVVGIILSILYGTFYAIRAKSFNVSVPLVPCILFPLSLAPIILSLIYGVPQIVNILS